MCTVIFIDVFRLGLEGVDCNGYNGDLGVVDMAYSKNYLLAIGDDDHLKEHISKDALEILLLRVYYNKRGLFTIKIVKACHVLFRVQFRNHLNF